MIPIQKTYFDPSEFKKNLKPSHLYVIPLGGCGMFGMNMTCYLYDGKMVIADAGGLFPDAWMTGVSMIIPSPDFWLLRDFEILAYVITHAHEDHIGALPYLMKSKPRPIYTTAWTAEVLKRKFMDHMVEAPLFAVEPYGTVDLHPFSVKFLPIGHSIPDASCLLIKAASYHAFHSGDFKFDRDDDSVPESLKDLEKTDIDLFLCDSTNAEKDGFCPQENSVCDPLRNVISEAKGNVYLASFSSNLMRFIWIAQICKDLGRTLYVSGSSLRANFELALSMGLLQPGSYKEESETGPVLKNSVVLMSGCQGEFRSALARLANNEHRFFHLQEHDTVVFSSRTIPGNEKNLSDIMDKLRVLGAKIITSKDNPDIHVSGHAFGGEVRKLLQFTKPKTFIPVHGTYGQQLANAANNPEQNTLIVKNGSVIQQGSHTELIGSIKVETVYVDDEYGLLLNRSEFLEKIRIAKKGIATLNGVISLKNRTWVKGPIIRTTGLVKDGEWTQGLARELKDYLHSGALLKETSIDLINHAINAFWLNALIKRFGSKPITYCDVWILEEK
jgi:ribonuclease J